MLRIGLLGLGAIGSDVIAMAENEFADRIEYQPYWFDARAIPQQLIGP